MFGWRLHMARNHPRQVVRVAGIEPLAEAKAVSLKEQLAIVRDITILVAIVLFTSGWLVAYFYYKHFGISIYNLNLPYHAFYLYSLVPIGYAARHIEVLRGVALLILISIAFLMIWPRARSAVLTVAIGAALAGLVPTAWFAAQEKAMCTRSGASNLSAFIWLDGVVLPGDMSRTSEYLNALNTAIAGNVSQIVAQSSDEYFVLYQGDLSAARQSGEFNRAPVFHVPKSEVKLVATWARQIPDNSSIHWLGGCK